MTKYQITRLAEGDNGFGIINNEGDYYSKGHFDGVSTNNFTFYKQDATLMTIQEAHKIAYDLNKNINKRI